MTQLDAVIVTVLRHGGDFRRAHAERLRMEIRHHNRELRLLQVLMTENPQDSAIEGICELQLARGYPQRWCVCEAFTAYEQLAVLQLDYSTPFVYMDLDTVCVGSILPLLREFMHAPPDKLVCLPDIYRPHQGEMGVMGWRRPGVAKMVAHRLEQTLADDPKMMQPPREDNVGAWLRAQCGDFITLFDRQAAGVWSYKVDIRDSETLPPTDPSLIVFHGQPRPWADGVSEHMQAALDGRRTEPCPANP